MKIGHFHLGTSNSGVGTYIAELCKEIPSLLFNKSTILNKANYKVRSNSLLGFLFFDLVNMVNIIRREEITVMHVHTLKALAYYRFVKPFVNVKLVYTGHGIRFSQLNRGFGYFFSREVERFLLRSVDYVVYIRKSDYRLGINVYGHRDKSFYIRTMIELPVIKSPALDRLSLKICTIGYLSEIKDPEKFLFIAFEVLKSAPLVEFLWVGGGDKLLELRDKVKKSSWPNSIRFLGNLDNPDALDILSDCDLYLCTSKLETYPITFIEAFTLNKPVLSVTLKGLEYEYGDAVYFGTTESIIAKIIELNTNQKELKNMKCKVGKFFDAEYSDIYKMRNEYRLIYEK